MFESLGQYKILDRIGAGGMGEIYRARDTRLGRTVAIKLMPAELAGDPDRRERFLREARASAALSHPNIAALYEIGEDQGQLFLAFEYVPGETLTNVIAGRPLNPRRAVDFAAQIGDALAEAHAVGIVHRDIKPDNVIITPKDKAKVLDFGLATWTTGGAERDHAADTATVMATTAATTLGTVAYMSPEQSLGERVDHRTDVFSLGIVLYEMLTGKLPFAGKTATALALQIVQSSPAPASTINRAVPPELDAVLAKALAKSIDQRYESAATMTAELFSVAALLDMRTEISESSHAPSVGAAQPGRRRPYFKWLVYAVLLTSAIAAAWLERDAIQRFWRRTLGPAPAPVIAVTPLELAETDASQMYVADGLTEDLITRLGQTPGLKVLGRSATRGYRGRPPKEVAQELGASVVLTGSIRPSAETVKVSLELIDPSDGTAIWSNQYTREVKDIFAMQAQVADAVANALHVKLQPTASGARTAQRQVDGQAYDLYLRGRQAMAEHRLADALGLFQQAVTADAGLAEAFAGLSEALHLQTTLGEPDNASRRERLRTAAERAYQLDPDLAAANVAMGLASDRLADALKHLRRSIELDSSYADGYHLIGDEIHDFDPERAIAFFRKSLVLDPGLEVNHADLATALGLLGRSEEARRDLQPLTPRTGRPGLMTAVLAITDLYDGHYAQAASAFASVPDVLKAGPSYWSAYVVALRLSDRPADALNEAALLVRRYPQDCGGRTVLAALSLERHDVSTARRLVGSALAAATRGDAQPSDLRCGLQAAAAMQDGAAAAALLDRISAGETELRPFALNVMGRSGAMVVDRRMYPWSLVAGQPLVVAARERFDAAYAREREVVKSALEGIQ